MKNVAVVTNLSAKGTMGVRIIDSLGGISVVQTGLKLFSSDFTLRIMNQIADSDGITMVLEALNGQLFDVITMAR
jgi:hypothetical protein